MEIERRTPRDLPLAGHSAARGIDFRKAKRALVRNSWGIKGYFTMPYDYISDDNLAEDFWTIRGLESV